MTYQEFKDRILVELQSQFPPDTSIQIHRIPRNNQTAVDGLTILEKGLNMTPTIYLEPYFRRLKEGEAFDLLLDDIRNTYDTFRPEDAIDSRFFEDFDCVKEHIVFRLVHFSRNRELLNEIPHIRFLDLAIIFYCLVFSRETSTASILIRNSHMKLWNTTPEELYALSKDNTPRLLQSHFENLMQLLGGPKDDTLYPMYVLTNESRFYGASCILYDTLLADLSLRFQSDLYIIPSSIHEVLLLPAKEDLDRRDFNRMIAEVNDSQLQPDEVLSDHVYYYSRKNDVISA